jgi:hypothetical protein
MELPRLAAKQKRYTDVLRYLRDEPVDSTTKQNLLRVLDQYKKALATCWKNQGNAPEDDSRLMAIERQLDALFGDARLRTIAR